MKQYIYTTVFLLIATLHCSASIVLVDSFDGEVGVLRDSRPNTRADGIESSPLFDSRWIAIRDRNRQADTIVVTLGLGEVSINMASSLPQLTQMLPSVFFSYLSPSSVALLGGSALQIDVGAITGNGFIYVEVDTQTTSDVELNRIALTAPGTVIIPSSLFSLDQPNSLDGFSSLNITIEGASPNFSVTIDEFSIIPEPSTALLCTLGVFGFLMRRRR